MKDLRREKRKALRGCVLFNLASTNGDKTHTGLLSNMSVSGACIYTQEYITEERIRVYMEGISKTPVDADVMWCIRSHEDLYRTGIEFAY